MIEKNLQHTHRLALLVVLAVTVALIGLVAVFGLSVHQNYIEVEADRLAVATDQAKESSLVTLKEFTKEAVGNKDSLVGFVITKDNLARFIDLVEEVGEKQGATTSIVSANDLGGVNEKKVILVGWQLELRLAGEFNQVWQGLKLIEALPVAKRIVRANLVRTSTPGAPGMANWGGGLVIELPTIK